MTLTPQQRKYLKGLGHSLTPVIHVGKEGISSVVISGINKALDDHELIKISLLESSETPRFDGAEQIAQTTNSECIQVLGKKILLYRQNPKKKKITLPE
jgi:RNA-binding protein